MDTLSEQYRDLRVANGMTKFWAWAVRIGLVSLLLIGVASWIWSAAWLDTATDISAVVGIVAVVGFLQARVALLEKAMPLILDTLAEHEEAKK